MSTNTAPSPSIATLNIPSIPSVAIFVRHSGGCKYAGDETAKQCRCPKHFRYSLGRKQVRQSARTRSWSTAEENRRKLERAFEASAQAQARSVQIQPSGVITIETAIDSFISAKRSEGLSASLLAKYTRELV